jgi:hypothetical protein
MHILGGPLEEATRQKNWARIASLMNIGPFEAGFSVGSVKQSPRVVKAKMRSGTSTERDVVENLHFSFLGGERTRIAELRDAHKFVNSSQYGVGSVVSL